MSLPAWQQRLLQRWLQAQRNPLVQNTLERIEWGDSPVYERLNEEYYSRVGSELPTNAVGALVAAGAGAGAAYQAYTQADNAVNFNEFGWQEFLNRFSSYTGSGNMLGVKRNEPDSARPVDGEQRAIPAPAPSSSSPAGPVPMLDNVVPVMRMMQVPAMMESSTSLNTLEPPCCQAWK